VNPTPTPSFRDAVRSVVPPWLADRYPRPFTNGFRLLYSMAAALDAMMQVAVEGLRAKFPTQGTPTALPYIGADRRIIRGLTEGDGSYAERQIDWLDAWQHSGSPPEMLTQLQPMFAPAAPPLMRIVTNAGVWYTLDADGTLTIQNLGNWNWDNRPDLWARLWLIIYSPSDVPWAPDGTWGDGHRWGDGRFWGLTITSAMVSALQAVLANWHAAHGLYANIIVAFDPASFNPSSPEPDGTWGKNYKVVGGVAVPSRLATARYLDGVS